jgi:hypothetical protein
MELDTPPTSPVAADGVLDDIAVVEATTAVGAVGTSSAAIDGVLDGVTVIEAAIAIGGTAAVGPPSWSMGAWWHLLLSARPADGRDLGSRGGGSPDKQRMG